MSGFHQYEEARRILVRAVAEIKGGEFVAARRYLERVFNIPSTGEQKADAYYWLSEISESNREKRDHLQSALGHDLSHHRARKSLAILGGRLAQDEVINPDRFEPTSPTEPKQRDANRFECPTCGARMVFSPDGQTLVCEFCVSEGQNRSKEEAAEQEFVVGISMAKGHQQARAVQAFECSSCGAEYLLSPRTLSITCAHCNSTYTINQTEIRELIQPEGIIPMQITGIQARQLVRSEAAGLSRKLADLRIMSMTGVYLPTWSFDLGGQIRWSGDIEVQENRSVPVSDSHPIHFDDLFVPATKPEPKYLKPLLTEVGAKDVIGFEPKFLANWMAETYQIPMADAAVDARALAYKLARKQVNERNHLGNVKNLVFYSDDILLYSYKLVLVPVWIGKAVFEDSSLDLLVNGKTGRVYLDKPGSWINKAINAIKIFRMGFDKDLGHTGA